MTSGFGSPVADGIGAGRMVAGRQFEPGAAAPRNQYCAVFEDNFIPNAGRRIQMTNVATTGCGAPANGSSRRRSAPRILLSSIAFALCAAGLATSLLLTAPAHAASLALEWAPTNTHPQGIVTDSAGNVYTANNGSSTVTKITPSGEPALDWATTGPNPYGITIDSAGNLYTANYTNGSVSKIAPDGTSNNSWGSTAGRSTAIAIDRTNGTVYTANYAARNVSKITAAGVSTPSWGYAGSGAWAIAVDPTTGNVYVGNSGSAWVSKITPDGTSTPQWANVGAGQRGIAVDSVGNVYTANYNSHTVSKITPGGAVTQTWATTGQYPSAITIDSADNVYVASKAEFNVTEVTPQGSASYFGSTYGQPLAIAVSSAGIVFTANYNSNNVSKLGTPAAPDPPRSLDAIPGNGSASIAFTVGAANGSTITNYEYSTNNGSTWTTPSPSVTTSPIAISGLTNGTTYQIKVRAINGLGTSAESRTVNVTAGAPGTPTAPVATPGDGSASIAFTAGGANGSAITNYEYSTDNGTSWTTRSPQSAASPVAISGLTNGTTYQVKLRAINGAGTSNASSAVSVTAGAPAAPTALIAAPGDGSASIAFTAGAANGSAITNYEYSIDNGASWTANDPSSTDSPIVISGLGNGSPYQVKLRAINGAGTSTESSAVNVTPGAPTAPTALIATAGNSSASIAFTAGADNGSAITNYEYSTNNGTSWTANDPSSTDSPIVISGLTNGTTYQMKLRAINGAGTGAESAAVSVTPAAAPAAPTSLVATPGNGSASIAFTAGADNGSAITNYQYSTNNGLTWTTRSPSSVSSPVSITGLTNGTAYSGVKLRAVNDVGAGAESSAVSVTPAAAPAAPTSLVATPGNGSASIAFTAGADNGAAISNYEYSTNNGSTWTTPSPSVTASPIAISGLTNGTTYQIKLRAINTAGNGTESDAVSVTPAAAPAAPSSLVATAGNGSASIAFTAGAANGSAITNYEYSINNGSTWTARSPAATTSPVSITGLANGTTYQVKLRAINGAGSGTESSAVSVTPAAPAPTPDPIFTPLPTPQSKFVALPGAASSSVLQTVIVVPSVGVATQRGTFIYSSGARSARTLTACTGRKTITRAGRYVVNCELTSAARSARRHGSIRMTLITTFTPTGGTASAISRTVTLKKTSNGVTG